MQVESTPPHTHTHRTHTGVGPAVWGATHPPTRACPALSRWPPPDLRPRKVVPASQAPCQKSPRAPSYLQPRRRGALHRGSTRAVPLSPLQPPGPRQPGMHAPIPVARGIFPHIQEGPGAGSREQGPSPGAHVPRHRPPRHSLTQMASSSSHAGPARAIPAAAAHRRSGLHSGSRACSSAGSKCHRHFPAAPRLRVPGATSAKACAPGGERRPGRSVCWEL